jgi:PAS domain S-box-containing protein
LNVSEDSVREEIAALQTLVAVQSLRAAHLALVAAAELPPMNEVLKTESTYGLQAALALLRGVDEIEVQIDQMLDVERLLLARLQVRVDALQQNTIWFIVAAVVVAIIFAVVAFALARIEAARRRKATEENTRLYSDLEIREAKIRRLVDSNIIGIMITELGGEILEANDAFLAMMGYSRNDLVSGRMRWTDITPPEWLAASERAIAQMRATGSCEPFEKEYYRKDGSRVAVLVGAAALDKGPGDAVAFVVDLTERKQAEGRQNRAEYLTSHVFERSPDGVCIVDRDYRYQRVNPTYARNWGMAAERIVGMHVADIVGLDVFAQTIKPHLDRCFTGDESSYADWCTCVSGRRYMAVTHSPLRPDTEHVEAALVISRDLTEHMLASEALHEMQTELAHVNRVTTMGQLTASIAHEVNQPIAATVTNAGAALNWLRNEPPNLEEVRTALDRIIKNGMRAGDVVSRIRGLFKKLPPQNERLDINEAVLEVIDLTRSEVLRNGVSLRTQLAKDLSLIQGDRIQLQQVMINLIINAVQAMSDMNEGSREMQVSTRIDGRGDVLVAVQDSGPGLNPEGLEHLFDAFYTTKAGGMGMGLSICRSIIEAHGGQIRATTNLPKGAIFEVTLTPIRESEP